MKIATVLLMSLALATCALAAADKIPNLADYQNGTDTIVLAAGEDVVDARGYGYFDAG